MEMSTIFVGYFGDSVGISDFGMILGLFWDYFGDQLGCVGDLFRIHWGLFGCTPQI